MFTAIPHKDKDQTKTLHPAQVLVKTISGHKVLDLYVRNSNGHVYAKNGQYFICLMKPSITSNSKITWVELDGIDEVYNKSYLSYEV